MPVVDTREIQECTAMAQRKDSRIVLVTPAHDVEPDEPPCNETQASNDAPMEDSAGEMQLAATVGKNLRSYRVRRGLTLERLAKASGVSRAMLSQVELGRSTPTIKVVWKVARALGLPFSALLLDSQAAGCCVVRQNDSKVLTSRDGKVRSRALFPFTGPRRVEFYELQLAPGATEQAHAHNTGTVENLVVTRGELELTIERRRERLNVGDATVFDADVLHKYANRGSDDLIIYMVIAYGERGP